MKSRSSISKNKWCVRGEYASSQTAPFFSYLKWNHNRFSHAIWKRSCQSCFCYHAKIHADIELGTGNKAMFWSFIVKKPSDGSLLKFILHIKFSTPFIALQVFAPFSACLSVNYFHKTSNAFCPFCHDFC